ncbi:MAG: AraC family transcriptional regulator [Planctomycetota bacterium]|nr:MAG: AraC family transcriptional regulator [Planctomycetota bacterium]
MKETTRKDHSARILQVLLYVQTHLDEALDLEALARKAYYSPYHFHRIFSSLVGESLKEHIRRLRLERAALQLIRTDRPVTSIAFQAGYETHEAFTRAFKRHFELAPKPYREENRLPAMPPTPSGVHFDPDRNLTGFQVQRIGRPMEVRVEHLPEREVAFVRHTGPYSEVSGAWQKLMAWLASKGVIFHLQGTLAVVYDDPTITASEHIRYDACALLAQVPEGEGEFGRQTIAAGRYAIGTHVGPYEELGQSYSWLSGPWLLESGEMPADRPPLEVYLNDPRMTPPEKLRTEIHFALED